MAVPIELLRECPFLADLDVPSLERVAAITRTRDAVATEILMSEGEPAGPFFVILDGFVRVSAEGRALRTMTRGGILGEMSTLEHRPRSATATCLSPVSLLEIDPAAFDDLLDAMPALYRRIRANAARRH